MELWGHSWASLLGWDCVNLAVNGGHNQVARGLMIERRSYTEK